MDNMEIKTRDEAMLEAGRKIPIARTTRALRREVVLATVEPLTDDLHGRGVVNIGRLQRAVEVWSTQDQGDGSLYRETLGEYLSEVGGRAAQVLSAWDERPEGARSIMVEFDNRLLKFWDSEPAKEMEGRLQFFSR